MFGIAKGQFTDLATEFQEAQIPIFKNLINQHDFLSDFKIVTDDQYIGIEKKYNIFNKDFWVYIEIEDAKTIDDITGFEVWFQHHKANWLPINEEEENLSFPIKHAVFNLEDFEELRQMINNLNNGYLHKANEIMEYHPLENDY